MPDTVDPATRSRMMSAIHGRDTMPEMTVRRSLHAAGLRYRLHARDLPGRPDVVLPRYRAVVFVHGCFWHRHPGCRFAYNPKSRREFWETKLNRNAARDAVNQIKLQSAGWNVMVVWECELTPERLQRLADAIRTTGPARNSVAT